MSTPAKGNPAGYFPAIVKRYGRSVQEWIDLIQTPLPWPLVGWLKTGHGLGHGHANALVAHTLAARR